MRCLAEAIYFEARSEPEAGQAAVAQVVLNRVRSGIYPDDRLRRRLSGPRAAVRLPVLVRLRGQVAARRGAGRLGDGDAHRRGGRQGQELRRHDSPRRSTTTPPTCVRSGRRRCRSSTASACTSSTRCGPASIGRRARSTAAATCRRCWRRRARAAERGFDSRAATGLGSPPTEGAEMPKGYIISRVDIHDPDGLRQIRRGRRRRRSRSTAASRWRAAARYEALEGAGAQAQRRSWSSRASRPRAPITSPPNIRRRRRMREGAADMEIVLVEGV